VEVAFAGNADPDETHASEVARMLSRGFFEPERIAEGAPKLPMGNIRESSTLEVEGESYEWWTERRVRVDATPEVMLVVREPSTGSVEVTTFKGVPTLEDAVLFAASVLGGASDDNTPTRG